MNDIGCPGSILEGYWLFQKYSCWIQGVPGVLLQNTGCPRSTLAGYRVSQEYPCRIQGVLVVSLKNTGCPRSALAGYRVSQEYPFRTICDNFLFLIFLNISYILIHFLYSYIFLIFLYISYILIHFLYSYIFLIFLYISSGSRVGLQIAIKCFKKFPSGIFLNIFKGHLFMKISFFCTCCKRKCPRKLIIMILADLIP